MPAAITSDALALVVGIVAVAFVACAGWCLWALIEG